MKAVISGVGPDQPGIVAAISDILFRYDCNIEDSTMTLLADEFAVILLISADNLAMDALKTEFSELEARLGLVLVIKPVPPHAELAANAAPKPEPYMISVAGHDRTGITWRVSKVLADLKINILDLNAQIIPGDEGPVYIMMVEVELPPTVTEDAARSPLRALATELGVEIQLRPLEAVAL